MALAYLEGVASTVMARFERRVRIFTRETIEKTSIRLETTSLYALILRLRSFLKYRRKEESAFPSQRVPRSQI